MATQNAVKAIEKVEGEIVDERTGQIVPRGVGTEVSTIKEPNLNLNIVGTLEVNEKAVTVLDEALKDTDIKIRPDGNIYVDWTWYADRLNKAFGRLQWGLIPQGLPISKPNGSAVLIVWPHWLVIKGVPIGLSLGECTYFPSNNMMSYADACEGAKSSAISRNCKLLGMTLQLWDKDFADKWKAKYAETYKDPKPGSDKILWRKKHFKQPEGDPLTEGKMKLIADLKEYYPDSQKVADALTRYKLVYSVDKHSMIVAELISKAKEEKATKKK
jgi:hypothetical protein